MDLKTKGIFIAEWEPDCPPLTPEIIATAERALGYKLPQDYLNALAVHNGGILAKCVYSLPIGADGEPESYGLLLLFGLGGTEGIDRTTDGITRNAVLIKNWRYPQTSVVISHAGDAGWVLDYHLCGPQGEPQVLYVSNRNPSEQVVVKIADRLGTILNALQSRF